MTRSPTIQLVQSRRNRQWRWLIVGGNGEVIGHGEQHPTKAKAQRSIDRLLDAVASGRVKQR